MTPTKHSWRLRAALAGLGVVSAVGAALGLGLTGHSSPPSHSAASTRTPGSTARQSATSPISAPASSAPQATTSGS